MLKLSRSLGNMPEVNTNSFILRATLERPSSFPEAWPASSSKKSKSMKQWRTGGSVWVLGTARLAAYLARRRSLQRSFQESFPALLSWLGMASYCVRTMSEQRVPPVPCHGGCAVGQLSSGCGPGVFRTSFCNLQEQLQSHVPLSLLLLLLFLGEFLRSSCLSRCPSSSCFCSCFSLLFGLSFFRLCFLDGLFFCLMHQALG